MLECNFALTYSSPNPDAFHECIFVLMSPKGRKSAKSKQLQKISTVLGAKHLKYTVTNGSNYINIDYVYLGSGYVDAIEEMVKTATIN